MPCSKTFIATKLLRGSLEPIARYMRAADAKLLATPLEPVLAGEKAFEDLIP